MNEKSNDNKMPKLEDAYRTTSEYFWTTDEKVTEDFSGQNPENKMPNSSENLASRKLENLETLGLTMEEYIRKIYSLGDERDKYLEEKLDSIKRGR